MSHLPGESHRAQKKGGYFIPALLCSLTGTVLLLAVIALMLPPVLSNLLGFELYNVQSGSMAPVIPVGSMVLVEPVAGEEISEGEIIAFRVNGIVVTHRVVENRILEKRFITKGDANEMEDLHRVEYDNLIGHVTHSFPLLGDLTAHITSPLGKAYVLAIILCGVLFHVLSARLSESWEETNTQT